MFDRKPILIVEDEPLVAMALCQAVEDLDGIVIGPAGSVAQAQELIDGHEVAAAVLDTKLGAETIAPVALRLVEAAIPFVVHTGAGLPDELVWLHPRVATIRKPAAPVAVLVRLLHEIQAAPRPEPARPTPSG